MATTNEGQRYNEDRERVARLKSLRDVPGLIALAHDQSRHRHTRV